jgi:hypothetical protein
VQQLPQDKLNDLNYDYRHQRAEIDHPSLREYSPDGIQYGLNNAIDRRSDRVEWIHEVG